MGKKLYLLIYMFIFIYIIFGISKNLIYHNPPKVIVLGIDAAEWKVLDKMISQDKLPNFKKLITKGSSGPLKSPASLSPISWTDIATGKTIAKHNISGFTIDGRLVTNNDVKSKRIWELLSEVGYRTGVYHYFGTYPPEPSNGFVVLGPFSVINKSYAYPAEIEKNYKKLVYDEDIKKTSAQFIELIKEYKVDFFIGVDYKIHSTEHLLWKYFEDDSLNETRERAFFEKAYIDYDDFIGELISEFGDNVVYIIVSDHGMNSQYPLEYRIDFVNLLSLLNLSHISEDGQYLNGTSLIQNEVNVVYPYYVEFKPYGGKTDLGAASDMFETFRFKDGSKVFSNSTIENNILMMYLNYPSLLANSENFTDFFGYPTFTVTLVNKDLTLNLTYYEKSGEHGPDTDGIIIAYGPMIKKGTKINPTVYDITPTLLYLYGLPIPQDMDGNMIKGMIKENYLKTHPIRYTNTSAQKSENGKINYDGADDDTIKRLKSLGYTIS